MSLSAQAGSEVNTNTSPDCIIADDRPIAPPFDHELSTATTACPLEPVTVPCIGTNTVNLLRIPINFKAIGTLALVDTGSVASLLAERIFLKISSDCVREKPVFQSFVSAGGHPIESCGCFRIPVKLPGFQTSQQFYVIKNLQEDCILGLDFLSQHKTSFSGSRKLLIIGKNRQRIRLSTTRPQPPDVGFAYYVATNGDEPTQEGKEEEDPSAQIECLLNEFGDIFAAKTSELGRCTLVLHHIETTGPPTYQHPYRTPVHLRPIVRKQIAEMLESNVIRPSTSPFGAPILLVKKKDTDYRFCVDYRKLNSNTVKDRYPLPRIDDTIDALHGAQYFTTLDLASGYWQIELDEESKPKTAFTSEAGHFEFNRMPFGLQNAPSSFQRLLNTIFAEELFIFLLLFIDDLIVFSRTLKEHLIHLRVVLTKLRDAGLKLKLKKCFFAKNKVKYLGHIVSRSGIEPDPEKIAAMTSFPAPKNVAQLRTFLGLTNYYRRFVPNFSHVVHALTELTKKNQPFTWDTPQNQAFMELKKILSTSPVLAFPDFTKDFVVYTDASEFGIGAVLSQIQEVPEHGMVEVVIAYMSRHLLERERHWPTIEKEAFAIIQACKTFYSYLYGRKFTVITDHKPLQWLKSIKEPTGRLMRWSLWIQQFDIEIGYRPGKTNQNADCLSRVPVNAVDTVLQNGETALPGMDNPAVLGWIPEWRAAQDEDEFCQLILQRFPTQDSHEEELDGSPPKEALSDPEDKFVLLHGGLIGTRNGALVVPKSLIPEIIDRHHNHKTAAHMGINRTITRLQQKYFWPRMKDSVTEFIRKCLLCAKRKAHKRNFAPLQPLPAATFAWQRVAMDIVGPLEESYAGNRYILTMTEFSSRYVETAPMKTQTAESIAKAFVETIILRHGAPDEILTDRGQNFLSQLLQSILDILQIKRLRTSGYRPECNGLQERFHLTMCDMLAAYVTHDPPRWDEYLPYITFAYNTSKQGSLRETPFYLLYGHDPMGPDDLPVRHRYRYPLEVEDPFEERWRRAKELAIRCLQDAQTTQKTYYDRQVREEAINVGDWVLLREMRAARKKFEPRWLGPFKVIRKISDVNYAIQRSSSIEGDELPLNSRLPLTGEVVHKNRLKLFRGNTSNTQDSTSSQGESNPPDESSVEAGPHNPSDETIPDLTEHPQPTEEPINPPIPEARHLEPVLRRRRVIRPPDRLDL